MTGYFKRMVGTYNKSRQAAIRDGSLHSYDAGEYQRMCWADSARKKKARKITKASRRQNRSK